MAELGTHALGVKAEVQTEVHPQKMTTEAPKAISDLCGLEEVPFSPSLVSESVTAWKIRNAKKNTKSDQVIFSFAKTFSRKTREYTVLQRAEGTGWV